MSKLIFLVALFAGATLYDPQHVSELLRPGLQMVGSALGEFNIDRYLPSLSRLARN
jgi:hypothetical protein